MKDYLLEYIYENINVDYLSDLKDKSIMKENLQFIKSISENDFSLTTWEEACRYLCGYEGVTSPYEAKKILFNWILE